MIAIVLAVLLSAGARVLPPDSESFLQPAVSGSPELLSRFSAGATSRSVAQIDLNGDGWPEILVGYDTPSGPLLGVVDGHAPVGFDVEGSEPKWRMVLVDLPVRADFLEAGDLDADGKADIVLGARGLGSLYLLAGRGDGRFEPARRRRWKGGLTALAVGEFGVRDGLPDLALSNSQEGVWVLSSSAGAWASAPYKVSPLPARALAFGRLDSGSKSDLALLFHRRVQVVRGEGGGTDLFLQETGRDLAVGRFTGRGEQNLAVLARDHVYVIETSPMRLRHVVDAVPEADLLRAVRVSAGSGDDLVLGGASGLFAYPSGSFEVPLVSESLHLPRGNLRPVGLSETPVSDLSVTRLNRDALDDLVTTGGRWPALLRSRPRRVFTVNSTQTDSDGDYDDGVCDIGPDGDGNYTGICTFAAALDQANASPGADAINFGIPGSGPFLLTGLDYITDAVTIDGTTQPGWSGPPLIFFPDQGMTLEAGNSVIRGVGVFATEASSRIAFGIDMTRAGNNRVEASYIGLDPGGTYTDPDGVPGSGDELGVVAAGIWIRTPDNVIGGAAPSLRNVISGTVDGDGILISGATATGNLVEGNYIGTDASGQVGLGNYLRGISISELASNNTVRGNLISGNGLLPDPSYTGAGVALQLGAITVDPSSTSEGPPTMNLVIDNLIGTDALGTQAIPNVRGVLIEGAVGNTVGSTVDSLANVVSGNSLEGVKVSGLYDETRDNRLVGNIIGMQQGGTQALGNGTDGVLVEYAGPNRIGGDGVGEGNVISGNRSRGVAVIRSTDTAVLGNSIGTDALGQSDHGNRSAGIQVSNSERTVIGSPDGSNIVSGNDGGGIFISGSDRATTIQGNFIGTDASGELDLGNGFDGIRILGGSDHVVGGMEPGAGNRIAYNALNGIMVFNGSGYGFHRNSIFRNDSLGIDLGNDGVTANDAGDSDQGPNNLQNFPELGWLGPDVASVHMAGAANTSFLIEFFSAPECDASNYGEGARYLAEATVTTDSQGMAHFRQTFSLGPEDQYLTATATGPDGSTSEFSRCARDLRLIVNTNGDAGDADPEDPACDTGASVLRSGEEEPECTLRAAIQQANRNDGADEITFDIISGSAPFVLPVGSALDPISGALNIDGTTQTGFASGAPAVHLDGQGSVGFGFDVRAADVRLAGLAIRRFRIGILAGGQGVTLHDIELLENETLGMRVTGDVPGAGATIATGLLRAVANGNANRPDCNGTGGLELDGDLSTAHLEVTDNCGDGIYTPVGSVSVDGNAVVTDNMGFGFRVNALTLNGRSHDISRNRVRGIGAFTTQTGWITITGEARIAENGPLGSPECRQTGQAAVDAPRISTEAIMVVDNCYNGLRASEADVTIDGNATISGNASRGILASGNVRLRGEAHFIESNGGTGISALNGSVEIVGPVQVRSNNSEKTPAECRAQLEAGIFGADGFQGDDVVVEHNCGSGILSFRDILIDQRLRATDNSGSGVQSTRGQIRVNGSGHVTSRNGIHGLDARGVGGLVTVSGVLEASRNDSSGIAAVGIDLGSAVGWACQNGGYGLDVLGSSLYLGGLVVCDNGLGGIRSQPEGSADKSSPTGTIMGASIVGNSGDGIRFEGGDALVVTSSNLYGNQGLAIRNLDPATTIQASGNWWGDPMGPGPAVVGNVTVADALDRPVATQDRDGDGVSDGIEDLGSNGGDANVDGVPDSEQATVATIPAAVGGGRILVQSLHGGALTAVRSLPSLVVPPLEQLFAGMVAFTVAAEVPGDSVHLRITFPAGSDACSDLLGWIPLEPGAPPSAYRYDVAASSGCAYALSLEDGGRGDADLMQNGAVELVVGAATAIGDAVQSEPGSAAAFRILDAYPNPARTGLTVSLAHPPGGSSTLRIFDMLGREVWTGRLIGGSSTSTLRLDVGQWPAGVYLLSLVEQSNRDSRLILLIR